MLYQKIKFKMGILKYYSPYSTNSIKIKIHLEDNQQQQQKLFSDETLIRIKQKLNNCTFNLKKKRRNINRNNKRRKL